MERLFGISYPTVKGRLDKLAERLKMVELVAPAPPDAREDILGQLEKGEIVAQLALAATFGGLAAFAWRALAAKEAGASLPNAPLVIGLLAVLVAFLSATQDIALDAYAVEVLHRDEQGPVSGLRIFFYRIGMLIAGAFAVSATDWLPWPVVFLVLGGVFAGFTLLVLAAPEPDRPAEPPRSLGRAVVEPLRSYFARPDAIGIALFLVFYKFGDNMGGTMVNPFLKDLCFSNAEAVGDYPSRKYIFNPNFGKEAAPNKPNAGDGE